MNKFAVITGSTGGIGEQVATRLAEQNWNLVLINRSQAKSQAQIDTLSHAYPHLSFRAYQADFMDLTTVKTAIGQITVDYGKVHALYNIAGYMTNDLKTSTQGIESQFAVNALAPYVITQGLKGALSKGAKEAGGAYIVNFTTSMISSIKQLDTQQLARPEKIARMGKTYAASKLVVNVFNQALWDEFYQNGISLLAVDPGPTRTPMTAKMDGVPWVFKILMPLMTKDVNTQTDKLMAAVQTAIAGKSTGLFISSGKVKKEHPLALDTAIQHQTIALLNSLANTA